MSITSDEILVVKALENNSNAFEQLIKRYQDKVFHTCLGFVNNEDDANDLTQEVFIKVYKNLSNFQRKSKFSTWLYRITINTAINQVRKSKIKHLFIQVDSEEVSSLISSSEKSDEQLINKEEQQRINQILNKLPTNQRKAFVLSQYQELSNKEISEIMEISVKAVESLIFRARTNLKEIIFKE